LILFIFVSFLIWKRTPTWKYYSDLMLLRLPIFGTLVKKVALVKFSRILSSLLGSWVSIVESLRITSEALWSEVYKQRVLLLREDVKKWLKIWEGLDWDKLFPVMLVQMIKIWEQTAQTDKVIIKIAWFYEEEVDTAVSTLNKLLEPLIIAVMALVVGFIAIGVMEPIMWLMDQVW
jgi:type IV pilus assembly protein PilC